MYLSLRHSVQDEDCELSKEVTAALEESGWATVTWSPIQRRHALTSRFFEGMAHAVEHADAVVVLVDGSPAFVDAELAFAYRHRRPVIAMRIRDRESAASPMGEMLPDYERALTIECVDTAECVAALRAVLADPAFGAMVDEAAKEIGTHA